MGDVEKALADLGAEVHEGPIWETLEPETRSPAWKPEKSGESRIGLCISVEQVRTKDGPAKIARFLGYPDGADGFSLWISAGLEGYCAAFVRGGLFRIQYNGETKLKNGHTMKCYAVSCAPVPKDAIPF